MNYSREPWWKLYRNEPADQRCWNLFTRCLRDFLVRLPNAEDGVIFRSTTDPVGDLLRVLNPEQDERDKTVEAIERLIEDGYLAYDEEFGRLWIRNFPSAQATKFKDAARKAQQRSRGRVPASSPDAAAGTLDGTASGTASGTPSGTERGRVPSGVPDTVTDMSTQPSRTCPTDALFSSLSPSLTGIQDPDPDQPDRSGSPRALDPEAGEAKPEDAAAPSVPAQSEPKSTPGVRRSPAKDPMGDWFHGKRPLQRRDVAQVHEFWKVLFGFVGHKFRSVDDQDAQAVADAIDAHGLETCLLVLEHAPNDDMVSGRGDERKQKHESLRYIFGNTQAFARIHRAALKARQSAPGASVSDRMRKLEAR